MTAPLEFELTLTAVVVVVVVVVEPLMVLLVVGGLFDLVKDWSDGFLSMPIEEEGDECAVLRVTVEPVVSGASWRVTLMVVLVIACGLRSIFPAAWTCQPEGSGLRSARRQRWRRWQQCAPGFVVD
jgi:hypothetical protein